MSSPQYRACIVGLTGIGARREAENANAPLYGPMASSHAAAYHQLPQTDVVAVCDLKEDLLNTFRETWQDVWPELRLYTNCQEMLDQEQPHLVSVCTPDHAHAAITIAAAKSGAKAVLCEKPIATSLEDADRMIEACEAEGVLLSVEHTRRWDPKFVKAREMVRGGSIGPLRTVVCEQLGPRAMLFRNGTHMIDGMVFFAGAGAQWLVAELEGGFGHFTEYVGDGGHDPSTDPYASAYIHFGNGVRGFYNAYKVNMPGSVFHLQCEDGRVEVSDRGVRVIRGLGHYDWAESGVVVDSYQHERQAGAVAELIDVLENGGELISSGREARRAVAIMLGILESHHAGNVRVDVVGP